MEMSTSHPWYHYCSLLHFKRISYWLEKKLCANLCVSISKELWSSKVSPSFMKNDKEMLKYIALNVVKETLNYRVKSFMANSWLFVFIAQTHGYLKKINVVQVWSCCKILVKINNVKPCRQSVSLADWLSNLTTLFFWRNLKSL